MLNSLIRAASSRTPDVHPSITQTLVNKLKVEETILSGIHELVFVTDNAFRVLSLNDAVERTLRKSRSEILSQSIFSSLLMKDASGTLINEAFFQTHGINGDLTIPDVSLYTNVGVRKVTVYVKVISELDGEVGQISFILTAPTTKAGSSHMAVIEEAAVKHAALFADMKKRLVEAHMDDLKNRLLVIERAENDIQQVRELGTEELQEQKVPMDIAQLCLQTVLREGEYANAFNALVDFSFVNFGQKDIQRLLTSNMVISAEQLTGPFFTALADVKLLPLVLEKLIGISVLTASAHDRTVRLTVEREGDAGIVIRIISACTKISDDELPALFQPYYGVVNNKTNLRFGSGLEGFIAKSICDQLHIPLQVNLLQTPTRLSFMLWIDKTKSPSLAALSSKG